MPVKVVIPPGLAELAAGRDLITTKEFAKVLNKKDQTIRKQHSQKGHAYGIKPTKIGNDLQWSVIRIAQLINGGG